MDYSIKFDEDKDKREILTVTVTSEVQEYKITYRVNRGLFTSTVLLYHLASIRTDTNQPVELKDKVMDSIEQYVLDKLDEDKDI